MSGQNSLTMLLAPSSEDFGAGGILCWHRSSAGGLLLLIRGWSCGALLRAQPRASRDQNESEDRGKHSRTDPFLQSNPQAVIFDAKDPTINLPADCCSCLDTCEGVSDALANPLSFFFALRVCPFGDPFSVDSPRFTVLLSDTQNRGGSRTEWLAGNGANDPQPQQDRNLLHTGVSMILAVQKKSPSASVGILELRGRLIMGNDSRQVEWSVDEWLKAGVKSIILDLSALDMMDSTGVGIIVMCHAKLEKAGGSLRVAGAQGIVQEILHMTHVDRLVRFFATAEEASENFAAV